MPANYARYLIGTQRTAESNRELGFVLAFVAGAINAGGFLAVKQYTSHVTGMVSSLADNLALGQLTDWNRNPEHPLKVRADRQRMEVLGGLLACFTIGGISGAYGFKQVSYSFTVPLALLLALLALVPTVDDLLKHRKAGS